MNYTTAVFDMDGTVLNTLGDLTDSMNYALEAAGHAHSYTEDDVRQFFGSGVTVAIVRALAREAGTELSDLESKPVPTPESLSFWRSSAPPV